MIYEKYTGKDRRAVPRTSPYEDHFDALYTLRRRFDSFEEVLQRRDKELLDKFIHANSKLYSSIASEFEKVTSSVKEVSEICTDMKKHIEDKKIEAQKKEKSKNKYNTRKVTADGK